MKPTKNYLKNLVLETLSETLPVINLYGTDKPLYEYYIENDVAEVGVYSETVSELISEYGGTIIDIDELDTEAIFYFKGDAYDGRIHIDSISTIYKTIEKSVEGTELQDYVFISLDGEPMNGYKLTITSDNVYLV